MKAYDPMLALKLCDPLARPGLGKVTYQQVKVACRTHRQVASENTFCPPFSEINYILFLMYMSPCIVIIF